MGRYTDEQTHRIMSAIHSKDTDIELRLRKALWQKGYRYRKNVKTLPGKPDIANGLSHLGTPSCIGPFIFAYSVWQMSMKATTSHLRRYPDSP